MGYPQNEGGEFILDVDASDVGIGGVLAHIQNAKLSFGTNTVNSPSGHQRSTYRVRSHGLSTE